MTKYSLRSVEAQQLTQDGDKNNAGEIADWSGGYVDQSSDGKPQVVVNSRTGVRVAEVGDYVVELSEGNFTVMRESEFDEKYDTSSKKK